MNQKIKAVKTITAGKQKIPTKGIVHLFKYSKAILIRYEDGTKIEVSLPSETTTKKCYNKLLKYRIGNK